MDHWYNFRESYLIYLIIKEILIQDFNSIFFNILFNDKEIQQQLGISGYLTWYNTFQSASIMKSLSIDSSELNIYFANYLSTISVIRLEASTGNIIDGKSQYDLFIK